MAHEHSHGRKTMRAVLWEGNPYEVAVRNVPKPKITNETDAIIRLTTAAICGSDLHNYHGILGSSEVPYSLGHEGMGIVAEVGSGVEFVKVGDRVVIPDMPDDGDLDVEHSILIPYTIYGEGEDLGGLGGLQAEYARVPFADQSLIVVNDVPDIQDKDLIPLSDIFATAWGGLDLTGFQPGDTVAVFGAGPVGLLVAYSAILRGASRVYAVDHVEERLEKAASIGAIPINFTKGEPSAQILAKEPEGVQRCADAIGEECLNGRLKPQQNYVIEQMVKCTSTGGGIGLIGVYLALPKSEGNPRGNTISPELSFPISLFWEKSITLRGGGIDAKTVTTPLLELIKSGRARPGFVFSKSIDINDAPEAYRRFDKKLETKVMIEFPRHNRLRHERHVEVADDAANGQGTDEANGISDLHGGQWSKRVKRARLAASHAGNKRARHH